jgi:hypothetical protein
MKGNGKFPKPPVDLDVFNTQVELYRAAITRALDGSKKAIAERNRLRAEVIHMVTQLGHYVSYMSEDLATLYTSGFQPAYKLRRLPQPLPKPTIRKIDHGPNSGTLLVWITPISRDLGKVSYYELRRAEMAGGAAAGDWIVQLSTTARAPISIPNLKPGAIYAFQARALNRFGFTDWSDAATFMCT